MHGLLIEKLKSSYFVNMKEIMDVIDIEQSKYNWLITDYQCNIYPSKQIPLGGSYVWLNGKTLIQLLKKTAIFQFIWGVFSAFPETITLDEVLTYKLPYADGNKEIWNPDFKLQIPLAEIEIIPWDSCLIVIIARSEDLIAKFKREYPEAEDLKTYNASL